MAVSKSKLFASALAVTALGAVGLGYAAPHLGKTWLPNIGEMPVAAPSAIRIADMRKGEVHVDPAGRQVDAGRNVSVDAPHTAVRVNKDSGKVAVQAPYTDVKVDPDKGRVRVRAPYVDLDIRW
jgi:hypothetical protein